MTYLFCVATTLIGCADGGEDPGETTDERREESAPIDRRLLVESTIVSRGTVFDYLETTGILESTIQAEIIPEANGRVEEIHVTEGDWVEAGEPLAMIGNPSLEATLDRARIERDSARRTADNARDLANRGAISQLELNQALDAERSANASWQEATANQNFTIVEAPISGEVVAIDIHIGEQAGTSRAFHIVDTRSLRVVTELPEMDLNRLSTGQTVELSSAYETRDPNTQRTEPPITVAGSVRNVGRVIDPMRGTARVIIAVDDEDEALRVGQFLRVKIEIDSHENVVRIPRMAMVWDGFEAIAWRVVEAPEDVVIDSMQAPSDNESESESENDDETILEPWEGIPRRMAQKARLSLGYQDDLWIEILDGLSEGNEVVLEGNTSLREESLLRLPGDPELRSSEEEEDAEE